ncbi:MAG: DUF1499 domain-containing protein [Alphaproteobacteria bacterium]|nr:DUF1499 domain-containing protein [Alphaproteobacteria bacterium]
MKTAFLLFLIFVAGFFAYVRMAPSDPNVWHVDPFKGSKFRKRNVFIQRPEDAKHPSPEFGMDAKNLAKAFDAVALATDKVERLAGSPEDLFVTYIARSKTIGYPDYISIKFIDLDGGRSTFAVFSRARFGSSDFGVNRQRFQYWLKQLSS